jgi:hypothetical protein
VSWPQSVLSLSLSSFFIFSSVCTSALQWKGWSNDNRLDLYFVGGRFEFRPRIFPCRQMLVYYLDSFQMLYNSSAITLPFNTRLSRDCSVIIDGFWIDDRIYLTLWYSAWLHFTVHYYTQRSVYSHAFTSRCSVAASSGGRFPSSGFQNYSRDSATSFSQQHLTMTEPQLLSNSLTHQPTVHSTNSKAGGHLTPISYYCDWTQLSVLLITSRHGLQRKHRS